MTVVLQRFRPEMMDKNMRLIFLMVLFSPLLAHAENAGDRFRQIEREMGSVQKPNETILSDKSFVPPAVVDSAELMGALLQAVNQEDAAQAEHLLTQYVQQTDHDPDMVLFVQANQAIWQNDIKLAIARYRQLQQRNPQFLRGKLDLARLLFIDKQNREAEALFNEIRLPEKPVIQAKVTQYQNALQQRRQWHGSVAVGWGRDSNLNRSNGTTVWRSQYTCVDVDGNLLLDKNGNLACQNINIPATAESPIGSQTAFYEMTLSRQQSIKGNHHLAVNVAAYGNFYPKNHDYDEHNLNVQAAYQYQSYRHSFSIAPIFQAALLDGHLHSSSSGVQMRYGYEFSDKTQADAQIEYKADRYRSDRLKHFNGGQTALFTSLAHQLDSGWLLFGGYDFLQKNSQEKVDSYRRHGVRLGINKSFQAGVDLTAQILWRNTKYRAHNAWFDTTRHDKERIYSLDLALNRFAVKGLTPIVSLKHTHNQSSAWLNRYRRNEVGVKIRYVF